MPYHNEGLDFGNLVQELKRLSPDTSIRFDFGYNVPSCWSSYRGYYEDLAIGYTDENPHEFTVKDFLDILYEAKAGTLLGYKGGEFRVDNKTNIWVAQGSSQCTGTFIDKIREHGHKFAIIHTSYEH